MKILTRENLRNQLRKGEIAPVYVLFGQETYLRDLAAKTITNIALKDSVMRDFNESEISLSNSEVGHGIGAARQLPMIDSCRVIRVTEVSVSTNKQKNTVKEKDEGLLKEYLSDPSESSVLIFIADEMDKRLKMAKLLLNNCVAVDFNVLSDGDSVKWVRDELKKLKAVAEEKTIRHLVGLVGNDVRKLTLEIEKLAVAALPESEITFELVESLVPNSREISNFELTDYLLSNNKIRSLQTLKKILDDGAEPIMLLGLLSYNFRRLFLAKEMMAEGASVEEVNRVVKLPYKQKQGFLENARRTEKNRFKWIIKRLAETDLGIKTSVATPRLQIEILVCELANS